MLSLLVSSLVFLVIIANVALAAYTAGLHRGYSAAMEDAEEMVVAYAKRFCGCGCIPEETDRIIFPSGGAK